MSKNDLEGLSEMVVLKCLGIRISDSNRMLGSHNELVTVTWVLIIMNYIGNEDSKDINHF